MSPRAHLLAAGTAYATMLVFWISTAASELSGSLVAVGVVKQAIPWGFLVLVPSLAVTGATGFAMARGFDAPRVRAKRRRMPFIAANGLLVLVPSGIYLSHLASEERFDSAFFVVQAVELLAGAVNVTLMSLNVRDGLRLSGRLHRSPNAGLLRSRP